MNLDRHIYICICKSGHMSLREKGSVNTKYREALPFHSVDTYTEAEAIMTEHCIKQSDGSFVLLDWKGDVDDVFHLAEKLGLS